MSVLRRVSRLIQVGMQKGHTQATVDLFIWGCIWSEWMPESCPVSGFAQFTMRPAHPRTLCMLQLNITITPLSLTYCVIMLLFMCSRVLCEPLRWTCCPVSPNGAFQCRGNWRPWRKTSSLHIEAETFCQLPLVKSICTSRSWRISGTLFTSHCESMLILWK